MKLPSLFSKTPDYKRFAYSPRHFNPLEERRKQKERIQHEPSIKSSKNVRDASLDGYRARIVGSFRSGRKTAFVQDHSSANRLRFIIPFGPIASI